MPTFTARLISVLVMSAFLLGAADPFTGTWKVNTTKSKFSPGPGPKSSTWTYTRDGEWVVLKTAGVNPDGSPFDRSIRYKPDGSPYPFENQFGRGKGSVKKIDDFTIESTLRFDSGGTTTSRTVISKDGKTRTQTVTGVNAKGEKIHNVVVLERQ
jgi:hypothetical protein